MQKITAFLIQFLAKSIPTFKYTKLNCLNVFLFQHLSFNTLTLQF
jgi:hypothetical protein